MAVLFWVVSACATITKLVSFGALLILTGIEKSTGYSGKHFPTPSSSEKQVVNKNLPFKTKSFVAVILIFWVKFTFPSWYAMDSPKSLISKTVGLGSLTPPTTL